MFLKRQYKPEMMDDFSIKDDRIVIALKELNVINRFLGGDSSSIKGIKTISKIIRIRQFIRILDVGAGGSNLSKIIKANRNIMYQNINVDLNKRTCKFSKEEFPEMNVVCSNALTLPFKKNSIDIVHVSLFLHHFNEEDIITLLENFLSAANYGIIINDLQRSVLALTGIKLLTMLFSKSEFVKNDGPLSVKRGFIKSELLAIFKRLNISGFNISRRWAFRWLIIIYK